MQRKTTTAPEFIRKALLGAYPEVQHDASKGVLSFPATWDDERIAEVHAELDGSNREIGVTLKAYTPSEDDKKIVKGLMRSGGNRDYDVNDFGFFEISASDTLVDKYNERNTSSLLEEFAKQAKAKDGGPGRTLLINHNTTSFAGATFDASVSAMPGKVGHYELVIKVYIPTGMKYIGNDILDMVNTGVLSKASIGYRPGDFTYEQIGDRLIGVNDIDRTGRRESILHELSLVYLGAVGNARVKSASAPKITTTVVTNSNLNMDITKTLTVGEGAGAKNFTVKAAVSGDTISITGLEDLQAYATGLQQNLDRMQAAEKAAKQPTIDKITSLQEKLKHPKDDQGYLLGLSYEALAERLKHLEATDKSLNPKNQLGKTEGGNDTTITKKSFWDDETEEGK